MTSESLDSREFSRIFLKIHFSISILSHLIFTFTSRSRFWVIWFSLSLLEKSEGRKFFTFHFSKMMKSFHISLFLLRKMSGIECNSSWIDWEFFTPTAKFKHIDFRFFQNTTKNNSKVGLLLNTSFSNNESHFKVVGKISPFISQKSRGNWIYHQMHVLKRGRDKKQ